jgi:hypothetical protein
MSTNIPMARVLLQAALGHNVTGPQMRDLIRQALGMMTRTRTKRVTAAFEGRRITPELEEAIWQSYQRAPEQSVMALALDYDVNPGRVSEVIARRSA